MKTAIFNITSQFPHYYNVHILIDGVYAGIGRFCLDYQEMMDFCRYHGVEKIRKENRA